MRLTRHFLERIEAYDRRGPRLNAVLEVNPEALEIAEALDSERASTGSRGPLHGIPVLLKDNIATADRLHTSAGSLALGECVAPRDAFLVTRLREAGAVILGKTNMTEWANFMTTGMPAGYSSRGGQVVKPYEAALSQGGSSSGSAVAVTADLCTVAVGTETSGSILSPANQNSVVGIKPTVGLVSRSGIVPIAASQDTAGPLARTVADAAALLGVLAGADPGDRATRASRAHARPYYTASLDPRGLEGARVGVPRAVFFERLSAAEMPVVAAALRALRDAGATLVDPADIPTARAVTDFRSDVMLYEFKRGLNRYLTGLGGVARQVPARSDPLQRGPPARDVALWPGAPPRRPVNKRARGADLPREPRRGPPALEDRGARPPDGTRAPRRARFSRVDRRGDRRQGRLPQHHRARGLHGRRSAPRPDVAGPCVERAVADSPRVRVRARHPSPAAAHERRVSPPPGTAPFRYNPAGETEDEA